MRTFRNPSIARSPPLSRVCSACGTRIERRECHKNRYGEYICRHCQAAGIKFVRRTRPTNLISLTTQVFLLGFALASLLFLMTWKYFPASGSGPDVGDLYDATIDVSGGTSLNRPTDAQRSASPGATASQAKGETP